MERITSMSGTGKVFSGDQLLGDGEYKIAVFQEFIEGQTSDGSYRIPGLKQIVGSVSGPFPIGKILKLVRENGDTLPFFITSSDGRIEASGPFLTKDGKPVI